MTVNWQDPRAPYLRTPMTTAYAMNLDAVRSVYAAASNRWTGCDWPTEFGPLRLPLEGLKSAQARLLAHATAGEESCTWHRAADWLARVEHDADTAQRHARMGLEAAERGDWTGALRWANRACDLEAAHRPLSVWGPLRAVLEEHAVAANECQTPEQHT